MGLQTAGGMWCEYCKRPVAGQRTTHRTRNTAAGLLAIGTAGLSLAGAKVEQFHCPICGLAVRKITRQEAESLHSDVAASELATKTAAEASRRAEHARGADAVADANRARAQALRDKWKDR